MKTHKNNQTKQLLIEAAGEIVLQSGFRSLTVRSITKKAEINTGSFVYHFNNKENFIKEVLENWYYPFFANIELCNNIQENPLEILRSMFIQIINFFQNNKQLINQLLLDLLANEKSVCNFVSTIYARHPKLMLDVITQGQQEKLICTKEPLYILTYLGSAIFIPVIFQNTLTLNSTFHGELLTLIEKQNFNDYATRMEWALKSIRYEDNE